MVVSTTAINRAAKSGDGRLGLDPPSPCASIPEGRLEGVLGVLFVPQQPPAHAQHQRSVSAHQLGEGGLVAAGDELLQQLAVGQRVGRVGAGQLVQVSQHEGERSAGHGPPPGGAGVCLIMPGGGRRGGTFPGPG